MILVFWGPNFFPKFQWEHPKGALNAISNQYIAIARKRLKTDGYMLLCVWPALNPFSIYVKFTAIVPGANPGEAKMCKKCAKMANFWTYGLNYWETVEDRWVHAVMRLTSIESSFSSNWHLPRLSQRRTQGRPKCALGWLQKLTHVPLAIAILLVHVCVTFYFLKLLLYWKSIWVGSGRGLRL